MQWKIETLGIYLHTLNFTANLNNWKLTSINIYISIFRREICNRVRYGLRADRVVSDGIRTARRGGGERTARGERLRSAGIIVAGLRQPQHAARVRRSLRAPTAECRVTRRRAPPPPAQRAALVRPHTSNSNCWPSLLRSRSSWSYSNSFRNAHLNIQNIVQGFQFNSLSR